MIIPPEETLKMENEDVPMDNKGGGEVEGTEFDDLAVEADKIEAPRCTKCRRMTSGHEGPYGSKCDLKILNTEELKEDDIQKLKAKEIKKKEKRKGDHEDDNEAMKKKRREEKEEEDRLNKARKEQEEMQKRIDNQREERRKVERETKKMKETLDTDVRRTSKGYSNWRDNQNPKNVNSRTRENGNTSKEMKMIAGIQAQEEDILPEGWKMTEETKVLEMDTLPEGCMMIGEVLEATESIDTLQEGKEADKNQRPDGSMSLKEGKEIRVRVKEMREVGLEQEYLPEGWIIQELMK